MNQWKESVSLLPGRTGELTNTAVHSVAELRQVPAPPRHRDRTFGLMSVQIEFLHLSVQRGTADAEGCRSLGDIAMRARQRP